MIKTMEQIKCKDRVKDEYKREIENLNDLLKLQNDYEEYEDIGEALSCYGLGFDYVEMGTFNDQKKPYFRLQISWGGPADEFRIYHDENFEINKIEYWFLDWFDGSFIECTNDNINNEWTLKDFLFTYYIETSLEYYNNDYK
tara:strand:- start:169 stop:594 length:426 start_codon:yes stop_codon:yes gene_type:complete